LQPAGVICHARTVNEEVLKNVVVQAFNEMLSSKSTYQKRLRDNLAKVLRGYEDEQALEIDKRLAELQQELINHASRKEDYNDIADEIFRFREMKQKSFTDTAVRDEQVKRINELNEFIEQQDSELTEFDESLARRWLKEIVVWDDRFSVELKSGVNIEIEI
jgi:recombinase